MWLKLPGILKVAAVLAIDFITVYALSTDPLVASIVTMGIGLYAWLGGYLALAREGAVPCHKLPAYDRERLEQAKKQLVEDVQRISNADISRLKIYLIPGDDHLQATAYGRNCVSVSKGTFDNTDPMTLNGVLAHEVSHILHYDAEFSRVVLANILLIVGSISVSSFILVAGIFIAFLIFKAFHSFTGVVIFQVVTKMVRGALDLLQKGIVFLYQAAACCLNRGAEYRCDRYAAQLGYGLQLAHFLSYAAPDSRQFTFTEVLYRTHPATSNRIARLEAHLSNETSLTL